MPWSILSILSVQSELVLPPVTLMTYKERLTPWTIVRSLPDMQNTIVARFRSRSDADGHLQFLRQQLPNVSFNVVFDCQPPVAKPAANN